MSNSSSSGWLTTLSDVETAIGSCLAALDRYEERFSGVLGEHGTPTASAVAMPDESHERWAGRLGGAVGQADQIDRLLTEQEQLWSHWQARFSDWARSLEHPA
jgi:hypothetical protein